MPRRVSSCAPATARTVACTRRSTVSTGGGRRGAARRAAVGRGRRGAVLGVEQRQLHQRCGARRRQPQQHREQHPTQGSAEQRPRRSPGSPARISSPPVGAGSAGRPGWPATGPRPGRGLTRAGPGTAATGGCTTVSASRRTRPRRSRPRPPARPARPACCRGRCRSRLNTTRNTAKPDGHRDHDLHAAAQLGAAGGDLAPHLQFLPGGGRQPGQHLTEPVTAAAGVQDQRGDHQVRGRVVQLRGQVQQRPVHRHPRPDLPHQPDQRRAGSTVRGVHRGRGDGVFQAGVRGDGVPQRLGPRDQRLQGGDLPLLGVRRRRTASATAAPTPPVPAAATGHRVNASTATAPPPPRPGSAPANAGDRDAATARVGPRRRSGRIHRDPAHRPRSAAARRRRSRRRAAPATTDHDAHHGGGRTVVEVKAGGGVVVPGVGQLLAPRRR